MSDRDLHDMHADYFGHDCSDPRFTWELITDVAEALEANGVELAAVGDPELVALERALHAFMFGGDCGD